MNSLCFSCCSFINNILLIKKLKKIKIEGHLKLESSDSFCWPTLDYTSYTCVHVRGWGWCMWRELCDHAHGEIEGVDKLL